MVYKWHENSRFSGIDPQIAGETLEIIAATNDGVIEPQTLVNESRPETAPLHKLFEWDDVAAAEEHRLSQARNIIRSVRVVNDASESNVEPVRVYAHVADPATGKSGYQSLANILSKEELREQELAYCLQLLAGARKRLNEFQDMIKVAAAVSKIEDQIKKSQVSQVRQSKNKAVREMAASV